MSNCNIVYFIMAHKNPDQLLRLIERLNCEGTNFIIHVDKKIDSAPFEKKISKANCFFIKDRVEVFWGGFSQVQATLLGMKEAERLFEKYDRFVFLSGQDYPIKSTKQIMIFFDQRKNVEFIDSYYLPEKSKEYTATSRIERFYWMDRKEDFWRKLFNKIASYYKGRKVPYNMRPSGGAAYFSFTKKIVEYIIQFNDSNKKYNRFFKYTVCPDEVYFQTLLMNSRFKDSIESNLHRVVFLPGTSNPEVMMSKDFEDLKNSNKFFARKFDSEMDNAILDRIDKELLNE